MGYADGYFYGQGKIICDTATFTAGDTIRVRSVTDANKIWNKTVVTAGTPLIFEVPGKDYYKICTVQTISDVETEVGGVYRTIDYGQTIFIDVLDKTSLAGIQGILNAHQQVNVLNIGDEVKMKVAGEDWIMQVGAINFFDSNDVVLVSKKTWNDSKFSGSGNIKYTDSTARTNTLAFYTQMADGDKQYPKEFTRTCKYYTSTANYVDKVWLPSSDEINVSGSQFPIFTTQANRVKNSSLTGNVTTWYSTDCTANTSSYAGFVGTDGAYSNASNSTVRGLLPCFKMTPNT